MQCIAESIQFSMWRGGGIARICDGLCGVSIGLGLIYEARVNVSLGLVLDV